jgi:hypothetical protein
MKKQFAIAFGILVIASLMAVSASAQCGGLDQLEGKLKPQSWLGNGSQGSGRLLNISEREEHADDGEGIVGLWRVTFTSKGNNVPPLNIPDGAQLDHAFAQWHSDGTEIMNSNRKPVTGSFCLGVWKKAGPSHYKLNHFALGFDDGVTLTYNQIREDVVLSHDGDSFTGSFSFSIFDAAGHAGPVLTGEITGTRVTVSTTLNDIL